MNTYETRELPRIRFDQFIDHSDQPLGLSFLQAYDEIVDMAQGHDLMSNQLEQVVWQERERLARELHDTIVPEIYSINLFIEALKLALEAGKEDAVARGLEELQASARESLAGLRLILLGLKPPILDEVGLVEALRIWFRLIEARFGLRVELNIQGEGLLNERVEEELYRIVQESVNNVIKHAGAKQVTVDLQMIGNSTSLTVKDDGKGFDLKTMSATQGFGLKNIQQRAKAIHASFAINTSPGRGTCLRVCISHGEVLRKEV